MAWSTERAWEENIVCGFDWLEWRGGGGGGGGEMKYVIGITVLESCACTII